MTNLHLGCGEARLEGFTNIDLRYSPSVDVVDNVKFLRRFRPDQVKSIYVCHVLEHLSRWEYKDALVRWFEILKPGGTLRIAVPDFQAICDYYQRTGDLRAVSGLLYGGQDYEGNSHYWTWDFATLKAELEEVGFTGVQRYDWRETEHAHVDDFSQAYLPHLDKENGTLMSLNVEAIKK
jgi:predicted SAM-dependent methyltransferase